MEKWANPEIAEKMLDGLKRGTQTVKERAKNNFVDYVCPVCKRSYKMKQWEINNRKACSPKCAANVGYEKKLENIRKMTEINRLKKQQERYEIKEFIVTWSYDNKEVILNCPLNKIKGNLDPLLRLVEEEYHVKDIRSVMLCFNITSRKEFILYLRKLVED